MASFPWSKLIPTLVRWSPRSRRRTPRPAPNGSGRWGFLQLESLESRLTPTNATLDFNASHHLTLTLLSGDSGQISDAGSSLQLQDLNNNITVTAAAAAYVSSGSGTGTVTLDLAPGGFTSVAQIDVSGVSSSGNVFSVNDATIALPGLSIANSVDTTTLAASLTTSSTATSNATGLQSYSKNVNFQSSNSTVALTATGTLTNIIFGGNITGSIDTLQVSAGSTIQFLGSGAVSLAALTVTSNSSSPAAIQLFGTTVTTSTAAGQTYNGGVGITNSSVTLDASGAAAGAVTINGGVICGNISNVAFQVTSGSSGMSSITGVIQSNGSTTIALTIAGGTMTLSGANTYSGATTISSGTLVLLGNSSITSSSSVNNGGTLDISGTASGATITTLSGAGTVTLGSHSLTINNASTTFSGTIAGSGGLIVSGGTQTLSGANAYTGATAITAGTLALSGNGSITSSSSISDAGTLDISGTTSGATITTLSGLGTVTLGANTLILINSSTIFNGSISGTGGLTVVTGTLMLTGPNGYTGTTTILAGALVLSGNGSIASSSVNDSGILDISGTSSGASLTALNGNGTVILGSEILTITGGGSGTFSGTLGGLGDSGGVTVQGTSSQTLSAATIHYTGATRISGGLLTLSGAVAFLGPVNISGGVADATNGTVMVVDVNLSAGIFAAPSTLMNVSGNFAVTGGVFIANGGTVAFTAAGPALQTLDSNGQAFANLVHSGTGILQLVNHGLTVTAGFTNAAGTFDLNGQSWTMTGASFHNPSNVQLQGSETITGLAPDTTEGSWTYVGDNTGAMYTVKTFGPTSYFVLVIQDGNANPDTFAASADLGIASFFYVTGGTYDAHGHVTTVAGLTRVDGGVYLASTATQNLNGDLTVSSTRSPGTFTGGTGTVTVQNVNVTGGTLAAPSTLMSVSGNFAVTGGVFIANGGTVVFVAANSQTLDSGGQSFNHVSHTGAGVLQLVNHDLSVTGNLTNGVGAGNFDAMTNGLGVTVLGQTSLSGGSFLAGTLSVGAATINTANVTTTGTQTYSGNVTLATNTTLTGTTVTFGQNLTLGSDATQATGTLSIVGNWVLSASSTLFITFAGTASGQFGHVVVSQQTTFNNATLALSYGGFTPGSGNSFDIVSSGSSVVGHLSNVPAPGPANLNAFTYSVTYAGAAGADLVLTVPVPVVSTATLRGTVFQDSNGNGVQDPGEPGLGGQTLFLDLDGSGQLKAGDPTAITDANGSFQFTINSPGSYTLRPVLLGGVLLDTPARGSYLVTITAGATLTGQDFAEIPASIAVPLTLPPSTPFPKQGTATADYVEALYRAILNRAAEPAGLANWTNLLNQGMLTRVQVAQAISHSLEHFTQEVTTFYATLLGRTPDTQGLQGWVQNLQNGMSEEQVAFAFLDSPEFLNQGDKSFVDHLYESLLGRPADTAGEANWLNGLGDDASGNAAHPPMLTHEQVITYFLHSQESLARLVQGYYQVYLQRLADTNGLNNWLNALGQGKSFLSIGQQFLASDEFYNAAAAQD